MVTSSGDAVKPLQLDISNNVAVGLFDLCESRWPSKMTSSLIFQLLQK